MSTYRFLPGLIIVQLATAALVFAAASDSMRLHWGFVAAAALLLTLIAGFWFASIAEHGRKDSLAAAKEQFARERERLVVAAEAEKRTIVEESHRTILRETNRAHARANFKLGATVVGMIGIAGVLLYIQLFTLALVTLTTAGGALAGYVARARQDARALTMRKLPESLLPASSTVEQTDSQKDSVRLALDRSRSNA